MEKYYNLEGRTDAESLEKMKRSHEEDVVREMLDRKELNASELIEKLDLVQMTHEEYQKFIEDLNEADEFWADCERKAAELEITVDYYLDEFL